MQKTRKDNLDVDVKAVYISFHDAWHACRDDYDDRCINAEHTLQSALYFHLRNRLDPKQFVVLTEVSGALQGDPRSQAGKCYDVLDMVVARRTFAKEREALEIIAAIELKFLPRFVPNDEEICKDLSSLSRVWSYKDAENRTNFAIERFNGSATPMTVKNERVLIYGIVAAKNEAEGIRGDRFWQPMRVPKNGRWCPKNHPGRPKNLVVAYCLTEQISEDGSSKTQVSFEGTLHEKYVESSKMATGDYRISN